MSDTLAAKESSASQSARAVSEELLDFEAPPKRQGSGRTFDRVIFHVDMDSFYASCELSRRPELPRDLPFIVGADPKEGKGRGVVIACNYPARKLGIHSALPISRAWELCPTAVFVRPDFAFYGEVSSRVISLIRPLADKVEQVSIDEAYMDVTGRIFELKSREPAGIGKETAAARVDGDVRGSDEEAITELARSIKKAVIEKERITCSIGVANSKIVAKIATDMNKPDGLTIVFPEDVQEFLAPLPVGKIPGVGRVTERVLQSEFKVYKISDLRSVELEALSARFGQKSALWLNRVASGIDESEVVEHWDPVSLSGETTFEEDEGDYQRIRKVMFDVAIEVHGRAERDHYMFKNVGIKVRFTGFETHTRSRSLSAATESLEVLKRECDKLLSEFASSGKKVRLIGVRVSGLVKIEKEQLTLLEWEE